MHLRVIFLLVGALLAFAHAQAAGSGLDSRKLSIADIPACGLTCTLSAVPTSNCSLDDIGCICTNRALLDNVGDCMLANCTMQESLDTARVQADLCNLPNDSKRQEIIVITISVYSIAIVFAIARTAGKIVSKRLGLDDAMVVASVLLAVMPMGCALAMTERGFGEHLWNLEDGALMPILKLFYIAAAGYGVVLGILKVALLLSYLSIFTEPRFRILAYITMAYIIINTIVILFLSIFICSPVEAFWNRDIKGKCISPKNVSYANSASAIVQDLILLVLPLFYIRNLHVNRWRKLAVSLMFATGTFGCIATIVRLQTLTSYTISYDPTWDYAPLAIWTELELFAGLVCISLPPIRILISRLLPPRVREFFSRITTSGSGSGPTDHSGPNLITVPPQRSPSKQEWYRPFSRNWVTINDNKDATPRNTDMELNHVSETETNLINHESLRSSNAGKSDITGISAIGCLSDRSYSEEFLQPHAITTDTASHHSPA